MVDTTNKTFVYEGKEWQMTGRTAKKSIFHKRELNKKIGTMTIVEIAPMGAAGSDPTFHKWVDPRELFYITEIEPLIDVDKIRKQNDEIPYE